MERLFVMGYWSGSKKVIAKKGMAYGNEVVAEGGSVKK